MEAEILKELISACGWFVQPNRELLILWFAFYYMHRSLLLEKQNPKKDEVLKLLHMVMPL